jgi:response regulator RpfG family c-di-GMP phosphodiesterase
MHLGTENILPVDFISKPFSPSELIEEVKHTLNIIRLKRSKQGSLFEREIKMRLDSIDQKLQQLNSLVDIRDEVIQTSRRIPGFFAQLGLDIVRILLIALAVLSFLYLGLGDFIRSVIETKP